MQTVNFTCGHCSQLMAVSQEHLGQQVRCPHCQQVVMAPVQPAPPPAPEGLPDTSLLSAASPLSEPESIFSSVDASADIFGASPSARPEIPPPSPSSPGQWPNLELSSPTEQVEAPQPLATGDATQTFTQPESPPLTESLAEPPPSVTDSQESISSNWMTAGSEAPGETAPSSPGLATVTPPRPRRRSSGLGSLILMLLVIIPLITYAVLATIYIGMLWKNQPKHPLEFLHDLEGDNKGSTRQKSSSVDVHRPTPTTKLPPQLLTTLGQPVRVGDIEVTPEKVELRRIWVNTPGSNPTEGYDDALVLYLHLKNVSSDVVFKPLDPCFDRKWKEKPKQPQTRHRPYTLLELGETRRYYGGPLPWSTPPENKPLPNRETVFLRDGERELRQNTGKELKPGEEMETFVCTDYEDQIGKELANYHGPLLWRVHVRRGLVEVGDREFSATAQIGVEFDAKDIRKPG